MFLNRNFFGPMVSYLIIYFKKTQNTMKLKRRHGEFEQGCVLSESYTATDTLPPILPACCQPLLPACVFVTWDVVCHPRRFLFGKFVREPICSLWEAFVIRGSTVLAFHWGCNPTIWTNALLHYVINTTNFIHKRFTFTYTLLSFKVSAFFGH
jgi:hypothetical protein